MAHEDLYPGFTLDDMRKLLACDIVHDHDIEIARLDSVAELSGNEWCGKGSEERVLDTYKRRIGNYRGIRMKPFNYVAGTSKFPSSTFLMLNQPKVRLVRDSGAVLDFALDCKPKLTFGSILDQGDRSRVNIEVEYKTNVVVDISSLGFDEKIIGPVDIRNITNDSATALIRYKGETYDLVSGKKYYKTISRTKKVINNLSGFLQSNNFIKNEVGSLGQNIQLYVAGKALGDGLQVSSMLERYGGKSHDILTTIDMLLVARAIAFDVSVIQILRTNELRDHCIFIPSKRFTPPRPTLAKPIAQPRVTPGKIELPKISPEFPLPPVPKGPVTQLPPGIPFQFPFPPIPTPQTEIPDDVYDANLENEMEIIILAKRIAKHYDDAINLFKSAVGKSFSEEYFVKCRTVFLVLKTAILFQYDVLRVWFTSKHGKPGVDQLKLHTECRKILDYFRNSAVRLCPPNTILYNPDGSLVDIFIICNANATDCMFSGFKLVEPFSVDIDDDILIDSMLYDDSSKIKNKTMFVSATGWQIEEGVDIGPLFETKKPTQIHWASNRNNFGIVGSYFLNLKNDGGDVAKLSARVDRWFSIEDEIPPVIPDEPDVAEPVTKRLKQEGSGLDEDNNEYTRFKTYVSQFGLDAETVIGDVQKASDVDIPDKGALAVLLTYSTGVPSSDPKVNASSTLVWNAYTSRLNATHCDFSYLESPWKPIYPDKVPNVLYSFFKRQEFSYIQKLNPAPQKPVIKRPVAIKTRRTELSPDREYVIGDGPPIAASRRKLRKTRRKKKKHEI